MWAAVDYLTMTSVAVKVPRIEKIAAVDRRAFEREAKIVASLRHDNIVHVVDANTSGTEFDPYLTTELIYGETLAHTMRWRGAMAAGQAASVGAQLTDALTAVHQAGYAHRDVKPENAVASHGDGEVKLIDFGLAAPTNAPDGRPFAGTNGYYAPETAKAYLLSEIEGLEVGTPLPSPASDIYAAGLVVHEMTTGKHIFDAGLQGILQQARGQVPPLSQIRSDVPRSLDKLIRHMTAHDPKDRPTAAEASDGLREIAAEHRDARGGTVIPVQGLDRRQGPEVALPPTPAQEPPAPRASTGGLSPVSEVEKHRSAPALPNRESAASNQVRHQSSQGPARPQNHAAADPARKQPGQGRALRKELGP